MSIDKSLKSKNLLRRHRNVLTRAERIEFLKEAGVWTDSSRAIGLPKVAHRKAAVGKKDKDVKKETADETTGETAPTASEEKSKRGSEG